MQSPTIRCFLLALVVGLASPLIWADDQSHCLSIFDSFIAEAAPAPSASLLDAPLRKGQLEASIQYESNIFSRTLGSTLTSSALWLSTVQLLRAKGVESEFLTPAFLRTVPLDIALTVASHAIALGRIPWLKRLFDGETFGKRFEFWTRAGANTLMGTTVINFVWYLTGIDPRPEIAAGAFALSAFVYPILQTQKNFLFKSLPIFSKKKMAEQLSALYPVEYATIENALEARVSEIDVEPTHQQSFIFTSILASVAAIPYENRIRAIAPELLDHAKITSLVKKIDSVNEQSIQKSHQKLIRLRHQLISNLLKLHHSQSAPVEQVLFLGHPFQNAESSIEFQRFLSQSRKALNHQLVAASLTDQAVAVGIAGGIFLYSATQWAATGTLPTLGH